MGLEHVVASFHNEDAEAPQHFLKKCLETVVHDRCMTEPIKLKLFTGWALKNPKP